MDVNGKRVLVVGLGKSGVASALFLAAQGARVTVSDSKGPDQLRQEIPALLDRGVTVETGGHGERTFRQQDLIVVSPGVPVDVPQLAQARELGIPVIGEIELAARALRGQIVAITGSNGKTTTTALTGELIAGGGFKAVVGGNIGTPAISLAPETMSDTYVILEVSSFQLETIQEFSPKVAVLLNVTPDHLDRHGTFAGYLAAKARIFENQQASDFAVLNADDPSCIELARNVRAQVRWFSRMKEVEHGAFVRGGNIVHRNGGSQDIMSVSDSPLRGAHNLENVLAAVCVSAIVGCAPERMRATIKAFKAVEHRLDYVATIDGVEFYNDSKATNVDATIKALESFLGNIHIIMGGKHKGSPYTVLNDLLRARAKCVYTIGVAAPIIEDDVKDAVEVVRAGTLDVAVKKAAGAAQPGDVVLLAPACSSFDQFNNYEERGRAFKDAVRALERKQATGN